MAGAQRAAPGRQEAPAASPLRLPDRIDDRSGRWDLLPRPGLGCACPVPQAPLSPAASPAIWTDSIEIGFADDEATRSRELSGFFEAAPPHLTELLEAPTWRVVEVLTKRTEAWQKAQRAADEREPRHPPVVVALDRRNEVEEVFTVERIKEIKKDTLEYLWAGRTLVVDARLGGLDASGLLAADADGPPPTLDGDPQDADWTRRAQFRIRRAHHDAPSEEDWPLAYRWAEASDEDEATGSVR